MPAPGYRFANTILRVSGEKFLSATEKLQTEAFGNASLAVVVRDATQAAEVLKRLEGNLTGSVYSGTRGSDDALCDQLAPLLRSRVGRFLNDKMPTGVAVSAAMNHGGPFPATGHAGLHRSWYSCIAATFCRAALLRQRPHITLTICTQGQKFQRQNVAAH